MKVYFKLSRVNIVQYPQSPKLSAARYSTIRHKRLPDKKKTFAVSTIWLSANAVTKLYQNGEMLCKHFAHLIIKALFAFFGPWLKIGRAAHFFQHVFFFSTNMLWCPYIYVHQLIAF